MIILIQEEESLVEVVARVWKKRDRGETLRTEKWTRRKRTLLRPLLGIQGPTMDPGPPLLRDLYPIDRLQIRARHWGWIRLRLRLSSLGVFIQHPMLTRINILNPKFTRTAWWKRAGGRIRLGARSQGLQFQTKRKWGINHPSISWVTRPLNTMRLLQSILSSIRDLMEAIIHPLI